MPAPDAENIRKIEKRLKQAATNLHKMEGEVAMAVTIIDYDSERRKALLARYAEKHLLNSSATAAETLARADKSYDVEFNALMGQYQDAQTTIKKFEVEKISWETARSLLARQRVTISTLPGTED